jgi:hypothetical protein
MLDWLAPKCPAKPEEKELVEDGFILLREELGVERLCQATVIEPTRAYFPDPYDGSLEAAQQVFVRLCGFMGIDPNSVSLVFGSLDSDTVDVPLTTGGRRWTKGASGLYVNKGGVDYVVINQQELHDPAGLVATMAHELAHVILLSHKSMSAGGPHMEALTDLAAIYFGLGIFTSNTLLRRFGWVEGNMQYWNLKRKGYISPEMAGWALSLFAWARGDFKPRWSRHLEADGKSYLKQGLRYLRKTGDSTFKPQP